MKKLILFDIDGTLCESGNNLGDDIIKQIEYLKEDYHIGVVGGGRLDKILVQLRNLYMDHYFVECGSIYYENTCNIRENLNLVNRYTRDIRIHELYDEINILVKLCLNFISKVDYTITGNFIDLRSGLVYVSLIGMSANIHERQRFIELDKKKYYRKRLLNILKMKAIELNISGKVKICEGGSVGLSIYPEEYDKVQVLDVLSNKYDEIHYFGDKYDENGNDYNIINNKNVIGHRVNNVNGTLSILKSM